MNDVNLNRVAVFVKVVDAGGFTAAARVLRIPKSSASRSVRQLEESLGVLLLQRTTRRLRLTGAGQEYYERVASALAGLEEAQAVAAATQDEPRGLIRLAVPSDFGRWLIAPVIGAFVARYPGVRIDVSSPDRAIDLVRDGFDLAIRMGRPDDSSLIVKTVGSLAAGLFASQSYIDRRGAPQTVSDLASHDLIGYKKDGSPARLEIEGPDGPEAISMDSPVTTDDLGFVHEAVRLGMGIGLLPISGCVAHMGVVRLLPAYARTGTTCSLVYAASRYVPVRVALFRDALLHELQERFANPRGLSPCPAPVVAGGAPARTATTSQPLFATTARKSRKKTEQPPGKTSPRHRSL